MSTASWHYSTASQCEHATRSVRLPKRRWSEHPVSASVGGDLKLVERDPAAMERALAGHARTQNLLADFLARRGLTPLSPVVSTIQFDLAWEAGSQIWVAEIKSLSAQNEAVQLRLELGQVLEYAWRLRQQHGRLGQPVLVPETAPEDPAWRVVCESVGVLVTWPLFKTLERALNAAHHIA